MLRVRVLVVLMAASLWGCPDEKKAPPRSTVEETPPRPSVDEAFVRQAIHPEATLVNEALVGDIAPQPGQEALMVTIRPKGRHRLAVVRGNHKVLADVPLGGTVLSNVNLRRVGPFKTLRFPGIDDPLYALPVETEVQKQGVCGLLLWRFRNDTLSLLGELASRCWTKKAGAAADIDPHSLYQIKKLDDGTDVIEVQEEKVIRPHKWDNEQFAFRPLPPRKR